MSYIGINAGTLGLGPRRQRAFDWGFGFGYGVGSVVGSGLAIAIKTLSDREIKLKSIPSKRNHRGDIVSSRHYQEEYGDLWEVAHGDFISEFESSVSGPDRNNVKIFPVVYRGGKVHCTLVKSITVTQLTGATGTCQVRVPQGNDAADNDFLANQRNTLIYFTRTFSPHEPTKTIKVMRIVPTAYLVVSTNGNFDVRMDLEIARLDPVIYWDMVLKDYDVDPDSLFQWNPGTFSSFYSKDLIGSTG